MKRKFNKIFAASLLALITVCGCSKPQVPERINKVGSVVMGSVVTPRNGEGELCRVEQAELSRLFVSASVEVLPFEHRVFRVVMTAEDIPGSEDVLSVAQRDIEAVFNISFTQVDADRLKCELPGTVVTLQRAFTHGVRAVTVEFVDRELAVTAEELKRSDRYATVRKERAAGEQAAMVCRAIDEFIMDTGDAPPVLEALLHDPGNNTRWRGPYFTGVLPPGCCYRRIAPGKYEFFISVNGKNITEDVL